MNKILGLWKNSWPKQGEDYPKEVKDKLSNHFIVSEEVTNYLEGGYKILTQRRLLGSFHNDDIIGTPDLICDNLFVWSSEYSYYVKKGIIKIDELLLENIHANNFKIPDLSVSDLEVINPILLNHEFPELDYLSIRFASKKM